MTKLEAIIKFNELGSTMGSRSMAERMRSKIENLLEEGNIVVFDFGGVRNVSNSFADECFGLLVRKYGTEKIKANTKFIDISIVVQTSINYAINQNLNP
jgi:hypothetical protein